MLDHRHYWIWLQQALGYASTKPIRILEHYETAENFYNAGMQAWRKLRLFTPQELRSLECTRLSYADWVIRRCERRHYTILTPEDERYPERLLRIKNPPAVLYVWGDLTGIDDEAAIAVVGTRRCTAQGMALAGTLGCRLAQSGMVLVSGGAVGCDICATKGALHAGARSVIVLGCGLDVDYLRENADVRVRVARNGAVITEYQPDYSGNRVTFPQRNRIMSALSLGTVVIEAPKRSGALITVTHALEQGKDVFAVPGNVASAAYAGNNRLLEDGAKPVYCPMDIVGEYVDFYPNKLHTEHAYTSLGEDKMFTGLLQKLQRQQKADMHAGRPTTAGRSAEAAEHATAQGGAARRNLNGDCQSPERTVSRADRKMEKSAPPVARDVSKLGKDAQIIYNCFTNGPVTTDIILKISGLPIENVLAALSELEIYNYIRSIAGDRYERI